MSRTNYFSLMGQVTFVPDLKTAGNGDKYGNLGVKITRVRKHKGEAKTYNDYFMIRVWRDLADIAVGLERDSYVHITGHFESYKKHDTGIYMISLVGETLNAIDADQIHESEDMIVSALPNTERSYGAERAVVQDKDNLSFADDYTDEDLPF